MTLEILIECWRLSGDDHRFDTAASEQAIASVEADLGHPLPAVMRELFAFSDGLSLFGGSLNIYALRKPNDQLSLVAATQWLRGCGWHIPDDVLIFGDTGSDGLLGLWAGDRDSNRFASPVIQVGEIFQERCMALVATNVLSFLITETANFALMDGDTAVLRKLRVPDGLTDAEAVTDRAIREWADPSFPETAGDPYESRLDALALLRLLA